MTEKICKYTLWGIMGISIVVFILFYTIGFGNLYEEDPKFNDPALTDLLLIWGYILIAVAVIVTIWSLIHGLTTKGTGTSKETGLAAHTSAIAWGICAVSIILGLIYGFMCKDDTMLINGKDWKGPGDIIITDTSMISIIILTIVTVCVTAWSMISSKQE